MGYLRNTKQMTFPNKIYPSSVAFAEAYFNHLGEAINSVNTTKLNEAIELIKRAYEGRSTIFSCGNGGSAAISNHLHCDHLKGCQTDTKLKPRVISLSSNIETITAIANDISYDDIFLYQLRTMAYPKDVLVSISSSGNSENIFRACSWAKQEGVHVIALTGFEGGKIGNIADINLHVNCDNYGVVEDVHQSLMHIIAQYIRLIHMDPNIIKKRPF